MKSTALCICLLCFPASLSADVIFDTFDKQYGVDSYNEGGGSIIGPAAGGIEEDNAYAFVVGGGDFQLDRIVIGVRETGGVGNLLLELHANGPDDSIGAFIEAFDLGQPAAQNGSFYTATSAAISAAMPLLSDGNRYWLVASTTDSLSVVWGAASENPFGSHRWVRQGADGQWYREPYPTVSAVFAVHATPVPEPSPIAIMFVAALVHVSTRRR